LTDNQLAHEFGKSSHRDNQTAVNSISARLRKYINQQTVTLTRRMAEKPPMPPSQKQDGGQQQAHCKAVPAPEIKTKSAKVATK